jgi:hypothetical protein
MTNAEYGIKNEAACAAAFCIHYSVFSIPYSVWTLITSMVCTLPSPGLYPTAASFANRLGVGFVINAGEVGIFLAAGKLGRASA